jgi:hypothetical protein
MLRGLKKTWCFCIQLLVLLHHNVGIPKVQYLHKNGCREHHMVLPSALHQPPFNLKSHDVQPRSVNSRFVDISQHSPVFLDKTFPLIANQPSIWTYESLLLRYADSNVMAASTPIGN